MSNPPTPSAATHIPTRQVTGYGTMEMVSSVLRCNWLDSNDNPPLLVRKRDGVFAQLHLARGPGMEEYELDITFRPHTEDDLRTNSTTLMLFGEPGLTGSIDDTWQSAQEHSNPHYKGLQFFSLARDERYLRQKPDGPAWGVISISFVDIENTETWDKEQLHPARQMPAKDIGDLVPSTVSARPPVEGDPRTLEPHGGPDPR